MRDLPVPWRRRAKPRPYDVQPVAPLVPAPVLVLGRSGFVDHLPPAPTPVEPPRVRPTPAEQ